MADPNFWEIEGESPDGNWCGLYQALTEDEGRKWLAVVIEAGDAPAHARYEDFRLAPPTGDVHPPRMRGFAEGWTWKQRSNVVRPPSVSTRTRRTRARRAS